MGTFLIYVVLIIILSTFAVIRRALSSTLSTKILPLPAAGLDPNWVVGFVDAEGCFSVIITQRSNGKWRVIVSFEINLHPKDIQILYAIRDFFKVGTVTSRERLAVYRVSDVSSLISVIIPFFNKHPLFTQKWADFKLWSFVVECMEAKLHLTTEGFNTILSYYAAINRGVSAKVAEAFPAIVAVTRPLVLLPLVLNPWWVSGFVAGDGGFSLGVRSSGRIYFRFHVTQHIRDLALMQLFISFFGCGTVYEQAAKSRCDFIVQDLGSIWSVVIPHFINYPLISIKYLDFGDFKLAAELYQSGSKFEAIQQIIEGMNSKRRFDDD